MYYKGEKWDKVEVSGNSPGSVPCVNHDHIFFKFIFFNKN
jgi:hypothetical protein